MSHHLNNDAILTTDELDKLLAEIREEETILRKTPAEIDNMPITPIEKENKKREIEFYNEIMVWPLLELAERISAYKFHKKIEFPGLKNASIYGRQNRVKKYLESRGCDKATMLSVLPSTREEIIILADARAKGFKLSFDRSHNLANTDRIARAKEYLAAFEMNQNTEATVDEVRRHK